MIMKIAMLFPGFGSQFVGMCKELYDEHRVIQECFEQASSCLDINFVKLCFASSEAELGQMRNAYTSIFLVSCAVMSLLKEKGIQPSVVAGFNKGSYAALFAAGCWDLPDGLYLLNKFTAFYSELLENMNAKVVRIKGPQAPLVQDACEEVNGRGREKAYIALYETEQQHVVAGHTAAVEQICEKVVKDAQAIAQKTVIKPEDIAVGLHSPLMDPVIERYRMYTEKIDFHDLPVCLLESLAGECISKGNVIKEQIITRIHSPVIWPKVMDGLSKYEVILQIGPGTQLAEWAAARYPNKTVLAINKPADITELEKIVSSSRR
jgi:[acyl-carrier-protein] S-malonyltransferase